MTSAPACIASTPTCIGSAPLRIGSAPPCIGSSAPTCMGSAPVCLLCPCAARAFACACLIRLVRPEHLCPPVCSSHLGLCASRPGLCSHPTLPQSGRSIFVHLCAHLTSASAHLALARARIPHCSSQAGAPPCVPHSPMRSSIHACVAHPHPGSHPAWRAAAGACLSNCPVPARCPMHGDMCANLIDPTPLLSFCVQRKCRTVCWHLA